MPGRSPVPDHKNKMPGHGLSVQNPGILFVFFTEKNFTLMWFIKTCVIKRIVKQS